MCVQYRETGCVMSVHTLSTSFLCVHLCRTRASHSWKALSQILALKSSRQNRLEVSSKACPVKLFVLLLCFQKVKTMVQATFLKFTASLSSCFVPSSLWVVEAISNLAQTGSAKLSRQRRGAQVGRPAHYSVFCL